MTNSLPWKDPPFLSSVNHLFLWAIYTMAMLNNQRVIKITINICSVNANCQQFTIIIAQHNCQSFTDDFETIHHMSQYLSLIQ